MTAQPKISVVVPSYNQGRYLEATLRSVLDQRYSNLELIVIDGGSTDGSVDILRRYSRDLAYWVSEPDGGHTLGLIKGFRRATGAIQCWLNADDLHEPHALSRVTAFFTARPAAQLVYGNGTWIDRDGKPLYYRRELPFYRWMWLYHYDYISQPATFWTRELYDEVGGLDPRFELAMDADLLARMARLCRPLHLDQPLARMRRYPEQRNQALREQSDREAHEILCRELNREVGRTERLLVAGAARALRWSYRSLFRRDAPRPPAEPGGEERAVEGR